MEGREGEKKKKGESTRNRCATKPRRPGEKTLQGEDSSQEGYKGRGRRRGGKRGERKRGDCDCVIFALKGRLMVAGL